MTDWFTEKGTIGELPRQAAARFGAAEALVFEGARWSFDELEAEVDRAARALLAVGVNPGDKIALWLMNRPEWLFVFYGALRIGAVIVPLNTRFRKNDLEFVVSHSNATTLIQNDVSGPIEFLDMTRAVMPALGERAAGHPTSEAFPDLERVVTVGASRQPGALWWSDCLDRCSEISPAEADEVATAVEPDGTIMILYTSGTTGFPKGVQHNHRPIRALVDRASRLGITTRDAFLCNLPLFHLYGLSEMAIMSLITGSKLVLTEGFDPDESVQLIERERVTMLHGFDVHYAGLMAARERLGADVSSMRVGSIPAGMGSTLPVARRVVEEFCPVVSAYGLTEGWACGAIGFLDGTVEQRCETSGYPMPGYEFAIVDPETGERQPDGVAGEILQRGYLVMQGYYREPELTAQAIDADGWLHTGDMGVMREDGYLRFVGRYKDMLKVGGENVSPMEVEGFLLDSLPVELVAIVGHPDEKLDEVPIAFVVLTEDRDAGGSEIEDQVRAVCRGKIASFKIPRRVFVLDEMPMTASGKIQKHKLRERAGKLLATG